MRIYKVNTVWLLLNPPTITQAIVQYGEAKHKSSFILEVIVSYHETRMSQMDEINAMPLYPTEEACILHLFSTLSVSLSLIIVSTIFFKVLASTSKI